MKKFEKYIDKIGIGNCNFIKKHILKTGDCASIEDCAKCQQMAKEWLLEEYEPEIDWSKVPIDTAVLVRNSENVEWRPRYFVCYLPGNSNNLSFLVFSGGKKKDDAYDTTPYWHCKLADGVDATPYLKEV